MNHDWGVTEVGSGLLICMVAEAGHHGNRYPLKVAQSCHIAAVAAK